MKNKNILGEVTNIGNNFEISIKDIIKIVSEITNKKKYQKICQTTNNLVKIKKKYYLGK